MSCSRRTYFSSAVAACFALAILISFGANFIPGGKKKFLIIAEYDQSAATNHIVHLFKIPMTDGVPGPREKVMDVITQLPDEKTPRVRFDLGKNQVYKNRYIITAYGQVVDMTGKKVLVDTHDQFIKASGDSIVFYTNDIFRGVYYSVLDLKTGVFARVTNTVFNPVRGKDVEPDCSSRNFKIWYYPPSAAKVEIVKDAGYGEDVSLIANGRPRLPMHWIDNSNFIYPYYNSTHDVVTLMKVNYITHEQKKLGTVDQLPENRHYSEFLTDPEGNIIYSCSRGEFRIDLKKNTVEEMTTFRVGFNFEISMDETEKGNEIKHKGQSIGNYFCTAKLAVAIEGAIAFPFEIVLEKERYLQGAKYWTVESGKWNSVGDSDMASVVGWTEE